MWKFTTYHIKELVGDFSKQSPDILSNLGLAARYYMVPSLLWHEFYDITEFDYVMIIEQSETIWCDWIPLVLETIN